MSPGAPARPPLPVGEGSRPTVIRVESRAGRARFAALDKGTFLTPRPIHAAPGSGANHLAVALIGSRMALLAGDDVRLECLVGAGVHLTVVEPAAMVAYDAAGAASSWQLHAVVEEGASLTWQSAPFIAATGSNVTRRTEIDVVDGGRLVLSELLIRGRSGETGSPLRSVLEVRHGGCELLVEDLDLHGRRWSSAAVLGDHKIMGSVLTAGSRMEPGPSTDSDVVVMQLAGNGSLARWIGDQAHPIDAAMDHLMGRLAPGVAALTSMPRTGHERDAE